MGIHKRLKQYSVIAGNHMSKVIEFSKGEAEIYVRNFIETHLSHAVLKAAGGLQKVTAYFTDTKYMKEQLEKQIDRLITGIQGKLASGTNTGSSGSSGTTIVDGEEQLTPAQIAALEEAKDKLTLAKQNVSDVEDDSDFNKENIDHAKNLVSDAVDGLTDNNISVLVAPSGDEDDTSITLSEEKKAIGKNLNKLRKWQLDQFEEEYSAEIYTDTYHDYKYEKTIPELCKTLTSTLKSLGVDIVLDPELYELSDTEVVRKDETHKNIEEDIKSAFDAANITYKRIDIDYHSSNYDPDSEDAFNY